ncbi:MAG: PKD domain-containing protein [Euryarchaeota archaeon]|nr:PKD domain-containing protein [Euryarchaeota archaeon]
MGKVVMNQRKILSTIIVGLMLVSTAVAITPIATATAYHAVWGTLRINNVIAGPGVQIRVTVPSKGFTTYITTTAADPNGYNFYAGFDDSTYHGAKVYFTLLPRPTTEANSVTLNKKVQSVEQYYLFLNFTNSHPNAPSNPSPANGATDIETNADLAWSCSDPDGDPVTYDVYFGTTNPPTTKVSANQVGITYDPGTLSSGTTYYWQIVAKDNIIWDIGYTSGPVWSFTTKTGSTGGNTGGNTGGTTTSGGGVLTADADGPYFGVPNSAIQFDGTGSNDTDGTIVQYDWKFFNTDTWNNLGATPTHTYTEQGTYQVTLRVTDDDGNTDEDTTTATTVAGNNQPTNPTLSGNTTGHKNVEYTYAAVSTDPDGDTISYTFNWGDGESTTMGYYPSGTPVNNATHTWAYAGVYNIWVQAKDYNNATSEKAYLTILIDTIKVGDIGYLIDLDGDGIYDEFESAEGLHLITNITKQTDGTYLIDSDGDSDWDWIYDPTTDTLTAYTTSEGAPTQVTKADNTLWYALTMGTILAVILIAIIYLATRKKQKPKK